MTMADATVPDMTRLRFTLRHPGKDTDTPSLVLAVLSTYLQPSSITSAQTAAEALDELTPQQRRERGEEPPPTDEDDLPLEGFLRELWGTVDDVASQIPPAHPAQDKLVAMIQELKALENPTTVTIWDLKTRLWTDLPLLGPVLREAFIGPEASDSNVVQDKLDPWVNKQSFLARLHASGVAGDFTHFGVWLLRQALEDDPAQDPEVQACFQRAAAQWILYAGEALFSSAQSGGQSADFLAITKAGTRYSGRPGLPLERWQYWKQQFGEVGKCADKETEALVKQVAARIEEAERTGVA